MSSSRSGLVAALRRLFETPLSEMDIHPSATIAASAFVDRTWPQGVHIGEGAIVGEEAVILSHDVTRDLFLDTRIGSRTVLMPRSIVLPGLTIGDDCLLMPGAVVTKNMPDGSVALGNPAVIRPRQGLSPAEGL